MDDDPDAASSRPAMDDDPDAAAAASLEAAMEAPVTAWLGPAGPLLRKLHSGHNLPDEIRLLRDGLKVLCIPLKNMSEEDEEVSFMVRWWMKIVRELCYDTEDRLDEVIHGGRADDDFSDLLARAEDASESRKCFRWSPKTIKPARHEDASESKKRFLLRGMAGVVDPPKKLVDLLALDDDDDKTLKVIPINGCSGVGKTTVARALYHTHGGKFQCRAFVTVSQNPDMRGFLKSMLSQLKAPPIHSYLDVPELIDGIQKHLQGKRYLIVIDDLWTASVWNLISHAFPRGDYCSRIIATSQIDDVALACCGYDTDYIYTMKPLNDHESRKIFFGILFGSEQGCPTILKGVLYEIIRSCGGLPLTIANLACLLASEPSIVTKLWKYTQDSLLCTFKGIEDVLNLMYNSLPPQLRTCFLYLSMYPHGYVIKKEELVKQLVAEGFLNVVKGRDREEIAEGYFDELVNRGMVQAVETHNNGEVLSCTVHQMVLDFIRDKSMEENFVITLDYFQSDLALPDKVRRLSVQFGGVKSAYIPECIITSQVRSFVFWGFFKCLPSPITDYGLLQVLSLHVWGDQENESVDLSIIHELFRLKYLKIECNITVKLPGEIRRLTNLGTLQVDARLFGVPSDIVYLERLLDLRLPSEYILPQEVAHMTSLRTLGYFDLNSNQNVLHLGQLTNLKDLQLTCSTVEPPAENLQKNVQLLGSILEKLRKLQSISLVPALGFSCAASTMIPSDSFSMVSPPPDLLLGRIELSRRCCIFFSLPKWFGELRKLCVLKIAIRQLWKEDVDVLKGILSLTALTLYIQTAPAKKIIIDNGGFQVLTYFKFMCAAPCLFFEQGAMPNVQKLKLGFNSDKMEPYTLGIAGFHYLTGLNDICVKFGVQYGEQFDIRAAESALEAAFSNRTNTCIIRVQRMDVILDGEEHKTTVTDEKGDTTSLNRHDIRDQSQGGARGDQSELIQGEIDRRGSMEKYEMVREIRSGNSGVVKLMRNRDTHELVALKFIKRGDRIDENVFREIVNHRLLRHPSIVGFNEVVLSPTHLGIVMEYAAGGELFERICNAGRFYEDEARYFFQQLVCGVSFCHAMQICHRNLNLENTVLDASPAPRLKICGFGYSKSSVLHSRPNSTVGTPAYIAPEVLSQGEYDGNQADVWSCGVMLYTMLVGGYPFEDTEDPKNFRKTITRIMSVQYKIPEYVHVSQSCHHVLSRIFVADPHERITMAEIRDHSWFLKNLPRECTKEAQQDYYNRQQADGASATSATKGGVVPSAYLAQSVEEIMKIVKEAQTVPNPDKPVSGYGWGTGDGGATDEEDDQEEDDEYDEMVHEVHASGDFIINRVQT